jgi:hypothetical protein
MLIVLNTATAASPTPTIVFSPTPTPSVPASPSPSPTVPIPTGTTTPGLTSYQGITVLCLVVGGLLLAGLIVFWGRSKLKNAQGGQDPSFIRSWIAISLVLGLLVFCGAALLGTNSSLQSILFGGLIASVGSAIAFYFAAQQGAAALNAVTAQAGTGPDSFSASRPPAGTTGTSYRYPIVASGLPAPTYQLVDGSLPDGLTLDANGILHGTPTRADTFAFKVGAFNANGLLISPELTVVIS